MEGSACGISIVLESTIGDEIAEGSLAAVDIEGTKLEKVIQIILPSGQPEKATSARFAAFLMCEMQQ